MTTMLHFLSKNKDFYPHIIIYILPKNHFAFKFAKKSLQILIIEELWSNVCSWSRVQPMLIIIDSEYERD